MLTITREFRFEAAHRLYLSRLSPQENQGIFGSCSKVHGHSYRLQVTLRGTANEYGLLLDFGELKRIVRQQVLNDYDHADLNALADFQDLPPTAENMSEAVFRRLEPHCRGENYHLFRVSVFETADAWASREADHAQGS